MKSKSSRLRQSHISSMNKVNVCSNSGKQILFKSHLERRENPIKNQLTNLAGSHRRNSEIVTKFLFAHSAWKIDFVTENDDRCIGDLFVGQQTLKNRNKLFSDHRFKYRTINKRQVQLLLRPNDLDRLNRREKRPHRPPENNLSKLVALKRKI